MVLSPEATSETTDNPLQVPSETEAVESMPSDIEITYYTDPLCSWSWAIEPQWRRLRYEFGDRLQWRYAMGGLIPDWQKFSDPLNDICRPVQMGPLWVQIRDITGMPVREGIWVEDPPNSSYPACLAVKAAQQQGNTVAEVYLRRLREAVMVEQRNIARDEVLWELAEELSGAIDLGQFQEDLDSAETVEAFREDIKDMRYRGSGRFPALILRPRNGRAVLLVGFRPYKVLRDAIAHISPETEPQRSATDAIAYTTYWGRITAPELAEALNLQTSDARQKLDDAVQEGHLARSGEFYRER
ncbi:DsbA family protein [Phormidium sp. CCY1219]|uniref:DsbA family protein n=1 Tax=Phormidium sp. CCY1219 TaxID=2886104 RepID=UPI002D1F79C5|nr:DsbA family protein [Phormidium sp. CCY1219]MEB3827692.1 DsbA family protein [Phormidium sp. CCY1219]